MSECRLFSCPAQSDFLIYNRQNDAAENYVPREAVCRLFDCEEQADLPIYNLQSNVVFNGTPITITIQCPEGYTCIGDQVTFPPGTIVLPPIGPDGNYTIQGCLSLITGSDQNTVMLEYANQLAICNSIQEPPPGNDNYYPPQPPAETFQSEEVRIQFPCSPPSVFIYSGTPPAWITVSSSGLFTGAAGTFEGVSQAAANAAAQSALNSFYAAAVSSGAAICQEPYENTLQSIGCGAGQVDVMDYTSPIDGQGIYAISGTVYAAAGYYTSIVSQAEADALALAAATARFNAAVAAEVLVCVDECILLMDWGDPVTTGGSYDATAPTVESYLIQTEISADGCVNSPPITNPVPVTLSDATILFGAVLPKCMDGETLIAALSVNGIPGCTRPTVFFHTTSFTFKLNAGAAGGINYTNPSPGDAPNYAPSTNVSNAIPSTDPIVETTATSAVGGIDPGDTGIVFDVVDATGFTVAGKFTVAGAGLFTVTGVSSNQITATYDACSPGVACVNGSGRSIAIGAAVILRPTRNTIILSMSSQYFGTVIAGRMRLSLA